MIRSILKYLSEASVDTFWRNLPSSEALKIVTNLKKKKRKSISHNQK